jgi:hypothetical protein
MLFDYDYVTVGYWLLERCCCLLLLLLLLLMLCECVRSQSKERHGSSFFAQRLGHMNSLYIYTLNDIDTHYS